MMKAVRGALVTLAIVAACLVAAFVIANLVDMVRPGTLLQGRNFLRVGLLTGVLICLATLLRRGPVSWLQAGLELLVIELVIAGAIWFFAGAVAIDALFVDWWLGVNAYLVLPWIIGTAIRAARAGAGSERHHAAT